MERRRPARRRRDRSVRRPQDDSQGERRAVLAGAGRPRAEREPQCDRMVAALSVARSEWQRNLAARRARGPAMRQSGRIRRRVDRSRSARVVVRRGDGLARARTSAALGLRTGRRLAPGCWALRAPECRRGRSSVREPVTMPDPGPDGDYRHLR